MNIQGNIANITLCILIMALNILHLLSPLLSLLLIIPPITLVHSRSTRHTEQPFSQVLQNLEGVSKGQSVQGLSQLKHYFKHFGYLEYSDLDAVSLTDHFDDKLESALKTYQKYFNLDVTGHLDASTVKKLSIPRCGVPDITTHNHKTGGVPIVANYTFFPGKPAWRKTKRCLTYCFYSSASVVSLKYARNAIESAFQNWAYVTGFKFKEVRNCRYADIVIGFHRRDHGDGFPFDGPGAVLAHAFAPEDGRLHYDGDEKWSIYPSSEEFDLESVAIHEIGHLLGLGHSSEKGSVMYPSIGPGSIKRDLSQDDIDGIRALYNIN